VHAALLSCDSVRRALPQTPGLRALEVHVDMLEAAQMRHTEALLQAAARLPVLPAVRLQLEGVGSGTTVARFLRAVTRNTSRLRLLSLRFAAEAGMPIGKRAAANAAEALAHALAACTALTQLRLLTPAPESLSYQMVPGEAARESKLLARVVLHISEPRLSSLVHLRIANMLWPGKCPKAWRLRLQLLGIAPGSLDCARTA
jgi:hypothetical protein